MSEQFYEVTSEQLKAMSREQAAQTREQYREQYRTIGQSIPSCAHLTIGYVRQHLGAGKERGWWQCTECERKFVPVGTGPA